MSKKEDQLLKMILELQDSQSKLLGLIGDNADNIDRLLVLINSKNND